MGEFNVLVLGAGPAGLLAAHTALKAGAAVGIWSLDGRKSELHGCQYLHAPVLPGMGEGTLVTYRLVGTAEDYRRKVYGDDWQGLVSPDEYGTEGDHLAWDIRLMYDRMWSLFAEDIGLVQGCQRINGLTLDALLDKQDLDLVISTIPRPELCKQSVAAPGQLKHVFRAQSIWACGQFGHRASINMFGAEDNVVECNGTKDTGWYRRARVFGHTTVEWPWRDGRKPPYSNVVPVHKPLDHNCDCFDHERVLFVGRYGKWQKGYLVHQVVDDVTNALTNAQPRLV